MRNSTRNRAVHLVKSTGTTKARISRSNRMKARAAMDKRITFAEKIEPTTARISVKLSTWNEIVKYFFYGERIKFSQIRLKMMNRIKTPFMSDSPALQRKWNSRESSSEQHWSMTKASRPWWTLSIRWTRASNTRQAVAWFPRCWKESEMSFQWSRWDFSTVYFTTAIKICPNIDMSEMMRSENTRRTKHSLEQLSSKPSE